MKKLLSLFFLIALIASFSNNAFSAETYECQYTSFSNQKGNHKEEFNLIFLVDVSAGKSYIVGNNGSSEVNYIDNAAGLSFIEITDSGNVMTTAIDANMKSVHSRNSIGLTGELLPSQYYGSCVQK